MGRKIYRGEEIKGDKGHSFVARLEQLYKDKNGIRKRIMEVRNSARHDPRSFDSRGIAREFIFAGDGEVRPVVRQKDLEHYMSGRQSLKEGDGKTLAYDFGLAADERDRFIADARAYIEHCAALHDQRKQSAMDSAAAPKQLAPPPENPLHAALQALIGDCYKSNKYAIAKAKPGDPMPSDRKVSPTFVKERLGYSPKAKGALMLQGKYPAHGRRLDAAEDKPILENICNLLQATDAEKDAVMLAYDDAVALLGQAQSGSAPGKFSAKEKAKKRGDNITPGLPG